METSGRKRLQTTCVESSVATILMTPQQQQDMERALLNPLVLHTIMPHLTLNDLKSCRSVSTRWNMASSSVMRRKDCCRIKFSWAGHKSGFCQYHQEKGPDNVRLSHSIDDLTQLLKTSGNFPCMDFYFCDVSNLVDDNLHEFFEVYGVHVKSLEFATSWFDGDPYKISAVLHKILMQQCPHLESLTLCDCPFEDDDKELSLPSLKMFNWMGRVGQKSVQKVVRAAPNLQKVDGFDMDRNLDVLLECRKIHTIQTLRCSMGDSLDSLKKFVGGGPRLKQLTLCSWDREQLETVQELLQVNRQTLKCLELGSRPSTKIKIPVLDNLKILKLDYNSKTEKHWPTGINLTETFPRLSILDITGLMTDTAVSWDWYFPASSYTGNLASVDTLKTGVCTQYWMDQLTDLCPNFKKLILLADDYTVSSMLPRVFRMWTHLEAIDISEQCRRNQPAYFDPIFTGLSEFTCRRLVAEPKMSEDEVIDMTRNAPSILALEGLQSLVVKFYGAHGQQISLPITTVSGIHGFKLLPNLQVTIESDHSVHDQRQESEFQAMVPFATLRRNLPCPS